MKEAYIAPEVKLIGFIAAQKVAAQETLTWEDFGGLVNGGATNISETDIKIPIKLT